MYRLLVVEDDAVMRSALTVALKGAGYEVESAENGLKALELASRAAFDCIISDIRMPGLDGVTMLGRFKEKSPGIKTILITGYSDDEPIARALNLGADGLLKKPFGMKDLLQIISLKLQAKEKDRLQEEKLRDVIQKVKERVGEDEATKILGESFARMRDTAAPRAEKAATLAELGKMAELRQEWDASIQAYEESLSLLADSPDDKMEFPIRLSLSSLFARKEKMEISLYHAREALSMAESARDAALLADAHLHLGRILFPSHPQEGLQHLATGEAFLQEDGDKQKKALTVLLSGALAFHHGRNSEALQKMREFLTSGKRHYLPEFLLAYRELVVPAFLLSLEEGVEHENALWLLEEVSPFLQKELRAAAGKNPRLQNLLSRFVAGSTHDPGKILRIQAFGKLHIFLNGDALPEDRWRSLKGRSFFLYLFYQHPKVLSEEHILDTFWPNLDPRKARHTFRTTLYFIRRALDGKEQDLLHLEKQKFGIKSEAGIWCDFLHFRDFFEQARSAWQRGERDRAALLIKEGEKLYKGPFLEGWSDGWSLEARGDYQEAFCWMMTALSTYLGKHREWEDALLYARRAIQAEPTLEEAHYLAMEALIETGRREEAVRQFQACRAALKKELEVEPSERTRLLYLRAVEKGAGSMR